MMPFPGRECQPYPPRLIEACRLSGTAAVVERTVKLKSRKRGLSSSEMVESFFALWAAGGERAEDFDHVREHEALCELIGHELPAAQTARDFLAQFHDDDLPLLQAGQASVPSESAALLLEEGGQARLRRRARLPARARAVCRAGCDRGRRVPRRQRAGRHGQLRVIQKAVAALPSMLK